MGSDRYTYDSATGSYTATGIPVGNWAFDWKYLGSSNYLHDYYQSGYFTDDAARQVGLAFGAGSVLTQNIALMPPVTISGTVQGYGGVNLGSAVTYERVWRAEGGVYLVYLDQTSGSYSIGQLPPGTYSITVDEPDGWVFTPSRYSGLVLAAGANLTENIVLDHDGILTGHAYIDDGTGPKPYADGRVGASASGYLASAQTDANGAFSINVPDANAYLCITGTQYVQPTCWTASGSNAWASPVHVPLNSTQSGYDMTAPETGSITVAITGSLSAGAGTFPLTGGSVQTWRRDDSTGTFSQYGGALAIGGGFVEVDDLPTGTYRMRFIDDEDNLNPEWWSGKRYFSEATDIQVVAGQSTNLGFVSLSARTLDVSRTFGQDRFSGAVQMTQAIWAPPVDVPGDGEVPAAGVPIIYIANGLNYPDALSAGPAAIVQQGALLLVLPTSIPDVVKTELTRLHPQKIVIVGGPASVSAAVESQLANYSPDVKRQSGADRFEASRNLAESVWGGATGPGAPAVFISTGLNFPDALDAGPAAGLIDAPVILVNGSLSALDPGTVQLLSDLGTINVFIAGGPGSVSPGIETELTDLMGANHVHRFTGETRYDAAAAINAWFFPTAETVFLATGANFPDALAGAPLAGAAGGPIYLAQPSCIPQIVAVQIIEGDTQGVWLLGGPASLTPAVEDLTLCAS